MSAYLVVNLKRVGDILSNSPLINKIKENDPHSHVTLLVYEEFAKTASLLSKVDRVITVDRKKLETFTKSGLFSDFYALNYLYDCLSPLLKTQWAQTINISNDILSTRIVSFLSEYSEETTGIYFSADQAVKPSNDWAIVYNDISPGELNSPIHFQDIYQGMCLGKGSVFFAEGLETQKKYDEETTKNFQKIYDAYGNSPDIKLIGIQAKTSQKSKDIPFGTLIQFIQMIFQQDRPWVPIILTAPTEKDREFIHRLNYKFDKEIISVESDMIALPSVVKSLDALVTPDTAIKHMSDALDIPTLEVSLGESPLFKQGTRNPKSVILSHRVDQRVRKPDRDRHLLIPEDLMQSLRYIIDDLYTPKIESGFTLYKPVYDNLGLRYVSVYGDISAQYEASRAIKRSYLGDFLIGDGQQQTLFPSFQRLYSDELKSWIEEEKAFITEISKVLLQTLRALGKAKEPSASPEHIVKALDQLISFADSDKVGALPIKVFRSKIENFFGQSQEENMKHFESNLFELKAEVQGLIGTISDFENIVAKGKINRDKQQSYRRRDPKAPIIDQ